MLLIAGMRDPACRQRLADALSGVPGVRQVTVSLYRARAEVDHDWACAVDGLLRATTAIGFDATVGRKEMDEASRE